MMSLSVRLFATAAWFLPSLAAAGSFAGVEVPAPLAPRPVVDTHWGVRIEDPYRFLETTSDPVVQKYMRAQADAANAILAKIPGRDRLLARIKEIDEASPATVSNVRRDERGGLFYLKRGVKESQFKLYRRDSPQAPEKLLIDPEVVSNPNEAFGVGRTDFLTLPNPRRALLRLNLSF